MAPAFERRIRLKASVLGIGSVNGQRTAVPIPENAVVTVFAEMDQMTELFWAGKELTVFTEALKSRNPQKSAEMLHRLQQVCLANGNVFSELMETVKFCTLGEITHALYEVGGQYRRNM